MVDGESKILIQHIIFQLMHESAWRVTTGFNHSAWLCRTCEFREPTTQPNHVTDIQFSHIDSHMLWSRTTKQNLHPTALNNYHYRPSRDTIYSSSKWHICPHASRYSQISYYTFHRRSILHTVELKMATEKVFNGREEFSDSSNAFHSILALSLWLGWIHFNIALILSAIFLLPLSKSLLFVPYPFLLIINIIHFLLRNFVDFFVCDRVIGFLALFVVLPLGAKSKFGRRLSRYIFRFCCLFCFFVTCNLSFFLFFSVLKISFLLLWFM